MRLSLRIQSATCIVAAPCTWGVADKSDTFADSVTNPMKPNSSEFTGKSGIGSR